MPKTKTKIRYVQHPKTAPEGMEFVDVKRTVGKNSGVIIRSMVPMANGEGYSAGVRYLTEHLPKDGPDGTVAAAQALRDWWVTSQVSQHSDTEEGGDTSKVGTTVPRVKKLGTVDKGAVAGAWLAERINSGNAPTPEEITKYYAGLAL